MTRPLISPETPVDLEACAREPIHIPGSIQPHGVLLAVDAERGLVTQASANAGEVLGLPLDGILGAHWTSLIASDRLPHDDGIRPSHSGWLAVHFPQRETPAASRWVATFHRYEQHTLIELAPHAARFDEDPLRRSYELGRQLEADRSIDAAAARVARSLRNVLGYDRVMIYRFDRDWNGEVIAESLRRGLEPYLGLHYPATDIPAQARALYLRNRVRGISDVHYTPSPIVPTDDPHTGQPLDLSDVSLRSVSPVHLEYLSNMGVTGTLVASIIVNGRLWGLISCHHYAPRYADHDMRELAEGAASALATRIGALQEVEKEELESSLLTVREKLITAFGENEQISTSRLGELAPLLLEVVDADGVAIFSGDELITHGHVPSPEGLARIRAGMAPASTEHDAISGVLHTAALGERFPALADLVPNAAGILFMPLGPDAHNAIVWTRREQVHDVRWGGNPYLSKLETIPGARLSPRQSFAAWQETVRGRARAWATPHLESARSLRVLIELMERKHYQRHTALLGASLERVRESVLIVEAGHRPWHAAPITFANRRLADRVGHPPEALAGRPVSTLLHDAAPQRHALAQAQGDLDARQQAVLGVQLAHADGSAKPFRLAIEPVRDAHGRLTHWLAIDHND
jgi:PAS domain S-box-containing protein